MVKADFEDGPLIRPVESVSTNTLVGLCVATVALICAAAMTWYLCRRRREHIKLSMDKSLAFRPPHRKPTAVKSPGSTSHYLKKSPSPTGPGKSPPGSIAGQHQTTPSPTGSQPAADTTTPTMTTPNSEPSIILENEQDKAELESNEKCIQSNVVDGLGKLYFTLRYQADQNALVVTVIKCMGLPERGLQQQQQQQQHAATTTTTTTTTTTSDPYVKLQLLPDKQVRVKTRVLRNTRDPVYNEDFTFFGISKAQLGKISLHFVVLSFDRYSRDDMIGEVVCPLQSIPNLDNATAAAAAVDNQILSLCRDIRPRGLKIHSQSRGELLVSLCWQPAANRLTVVVLKARNLPKMDVTGLADPYVKIYLLYNSQRIAKKKTHVKKRTLCPVFNESFVFEIPNNGTDAPGLANVNLEFMLLDWDRVTKNEVIGRLELGGYKCHGSALNHWNEVCNSPRRQIADWHKLKE